MRFALYLTNSLRARVVLANFFCGKEKGLSPLILE